MGIEASYRHIDAAEWDQLQQLQLSYPTLDGFDRYEAYACIADSDELRSSDRHLTIDKDWHILRVLPTGEISNPSNIPPVPPPMGNVVMGGTEMPIDATYGKVRFLKPEAVREVANALSQISVKDLRARFDPIAFTEAEA
jgi:hypothetical protein